MITSANNIQPFIYICQTVYSCKSSWNDLSKPAVLILDIANIFHLKGNSLNVGFYAIKVSVISVKF